jgi:hypothetical protein
MSWRRRRCGLAVAVAVAVVCGRRSEIHHGMAGSRFLWFFGLVEEKKE